MNRKEQDCINDKWSNRAIGLLILPIALLVGMVSVVLLPILGIVFAVPIFAFSLLLMFGSQSSACRMLLSKGR